MVFVTSMVERDVEKKVDIDFIQSEMSHVSDDISIIYVCVNDNWRKDESWIDEGTQYHRIILPYEKVLKMKPVKVRQLMLKLAKERLGLSSKKAAA